MYLHQKNVVHGDLKGVSLSLIRRNSHSTQTDIQVNILVGPDHKALITDFGISRLVDESLTVSRTRATTARQLIRGTSRWMAPECLEGARHTKASDVYSFAMTVWEVRSDFNLDMCS